MMPANPNSRAAFETLKAPNPSAKVTFSGYLHVAILPARICSANGSADLNNKHEYFGGRPIFQRRSVGARPQRGQTCYHFAMDAPSLSSRDPVSRTAYAIRHRRPHRRKWGRRTTYRPFVYVEPFVARPRPAWWS